MPMSLGTMIVIVIVILILLPLTVWVRRLQARGVISDDRPLGRVIRERLTGKPPSSPHLTTASPGCATTALSS
jgi:hypothetical protein